MIKEVPFLSHFLRTIASKLGARKRQHFDSPTTWIRRLLTGEDLSIVQIGSNDGLTRDPLRSVIVEKESWKALFVEPVPALFERLKKNYGDDSRFSFENSAVNDGSEQIFFLVRENAKNSIPDLPNWFNQIGSFSKDHIVQHLNGILEPFIEEQIVAGTTLADLFDRNKIESINLLHIDAETYDWKILSQLDLDRFDPEIILFEFVHLAQTEVKEAIAYLMTGYAIFRLGNDFICLNKCKIPKTSIRKLRGEPIK